jgi:Na+-translocating ferredoxin:NAD+ oxidoreductase RnfG subunit
MTPTTTIILLVLLFVLGFLLGTTAASAQTQTEKFTASVRVVAIRTITPQSAEENRDDQKNWVHVTTDKDGRMMASY